MLLCFVAEFGPRPQRGALAVCLVGVVIVVIVVLDALGDLGDLGDLRRLLFRRGPSN